MDPKDQTKEEPKEKLTAEQKNAAQAGSKQAKLQKQSKRLETEAELKNTNPEQLRQKLSNKNADYIFRLEKAMRDNEKLAGEQVDNAINSILPEIIIAQYKGMPASTLYRQSPTEKAHELAHPKAKPVESKFWMQIVDNVLLYLTFFLGMFGVVQLFMPKSKDSQSSEMGIITMLSVAILFGIIMAYYNNMLARDKEDRPAIWKMIAIAAVVLMAVFLWITFTSLPVFRPFNPIINPWIEIILAVLAFLGRRFFKQKYHVVDPLKQRAQNQKRD
ncbi:putative membrane-anchored protein [Lactobacillus colini]|uniref:Membrane-anchored protein n=1 Tax=Lactobacillus colini TaxID=1819254 RepID=A0ABS4MEN9_9LACO|nr:DUF1129 family protein [Lactobacillus colini]MBP2058148.1 putative membrane-anchored protein [Lactobacillus colini]